MENVMQRKLWLAIAAAGLVAAPLVTQAAASDDSHIVIAQAGGGGGGGAGGGGGGGAGGGGGGGGRRRGRSRWRRLGHEQQRGGARVQSSRIHLPRGAVERRDGLRRAERRVRPDESRHRRPGSPAQPRPRSRYEQRRQQHSWQRVWQRYRRRHDAIDRVIDVETAAVEKGARAAPFFIAARLCSSLAQPPRGGARGTPR